MVTHTPKVSTKIRSFQDLEAWKVCRKVRQSIFAVAKKLPPEEKYRLGDQMIRASRSAAANLAEGYGRYHYLETIQFCRQARGSLYELVEHLTTALDCGCVSRKTYNEQEQQILDAIRVLNGFVRYLRSRRAGEKAAT